MGGGWSGHDKARNGGVGFPIIAQFGIMFERFGVFSGGCGWHLDAAIQLAGKLTC
jgi:hypothetical protein